MVFYAHSTITVISGRVNDADAENITQWPVMLVEDTQSTLLSNLGSDGTEHVDGVRPRAPTLVTGPVTVGTDCVTEQVTENIIITDLLVTKGTEHATSLHHVTDDTEHVADIVTMTQNTLQA